MTTIVHKSAHCYGDEIQLHKPTKTDMNKLALTHPCLNLFYINAHTYIRKQGLNKLWQLAEECVS